MKWSGKYLFALLPLLVLPATFNACSGFQATPVNQAFQGSSGVGVRLPKVCNVSDPGTVPLRHLSRDEYTYTVNDLFGLNLSFADEIPLDRAGVTGFLNNAEVQKMDDTLAKGYFEASQKVVAAAFAARSRVLQCGGDELTPPATATTQLAESCEDLVLKRVATLAWRRSLAIDEVTLLKEVSKAVRASGGSAREGVSFAIETILMSPNFIYIVPTGQMAGGRLNLDSYSMASRLSYFLWNSLPDKALYEAAAAGQLTNKDQLKAQVERMMKDARIKRFATTFVNQWLSISKIMSTAEVSTEGLTDALRVAMKTETELFFQTLIEENRSPTEVLSGQFTFLNGTLAQHYGLSGITGNGFQRVSSAITGRRGILTQASLMTTTSNARETKPTARGNLILTRVVCAPPPAFPDNEGVTQLEDGDPNATIRERMEVHRQNPACFGCHVQMDPVGLAYEHFDKLGQYRSTYPVINKPVDPSGVLNGKTFKDHNELGLVMVESGDFGQCFSEKVMSYATGRNVSRDSKDDACVTEAIGEGTIVPKGSFSDFLTAIVTSDAFMKNQVN